MTLAAPEPTFTEAHTEAHWVWQRASGHCLPPGGVKAVDVVKCAAV